MANELGEKHDERFTKIQYKLWAEALDVGKHQSKEDPRVVQSGEIRSQKKVPRKILTVVLTKWRQPSQIWPIQ